MSRRLPSLGAYLPETDLLEMVIAVGMAGVDDAVFISHS